MRRSRRYGLVLACASLAISLQAARDYLTPDEVDRIREAQTIFPRTREYLLMATSRIQEVGRRLGKAYETKIPGEKEKKEKKPKKDEKSLSSAAEPENPLLFSSLPDLAGGVSQCLQAIMTNIDERFQLKRDPPEEIAKATLLLKDYLEQSLPFLQDLQDKAEKESDERLARAVALLQEDLEQALQGAKQGLAVLGDPSEKSKSKPKR